MAKEDYSYLDQDETPDGLSDIQSDNITIPFLKIVQSLSSVKKSIEDAKDGQFWLQGDDFVTDTVNVIPLQFIRCYTRWEPQSERDRVTRRGAFRGAMLPKDAMRITICSDFGKWEDEKGQFLHETYLYAILIEGREQLGALRIEFHSSGIKDAQEWNRQMKTCFREDGVRAMMHHQVWTLSTSQRDNSVGDWKGIDAAFKGFVTPAQLMVGSDMKKGAPLRISDESFAQLDGPSVASTPAQDTINKDVPSW